MNIDIRFRNEFQRKAFWLRERNQCLSGGFNNGKTYVMCQKALTLALTYPNYRSIFARQTYKDLKTTTMQTFFKVCPRSLIHTHDNQSGITVLKNRSVFFWMHLDAFDEQSLRGLEPNSVFVDQAEEMQESIYLVLDSRIGRWDKAEVPENFLTQYPNWPRNDIGIPRVPNYMVLGCNPDSQFHFIYQRYHPESVDRRPNHVMIEAQTDENLGDPETMEQMKGRDPEWVKKYFLGKWGVSEAQIHYVDPSSILDYNDERVQKFLAAVLEKGNLYRVLDHGENAPTCCTWWAAYKHYHVGFREYYVPGRLISFHRKEIDSLCQHTDEFGNIIRERYAGSYADPQIFKKTNQKDGGFWSVADEYITKDIEAPRIYWTPADNNELSTRNRINECLKVDPLIPHPITGELGSPRTFYIKRSSAYPSGMFHTIKQTQSARRELLTTIDGRGIYSDDREEAVEDHAYDTERYYFAMHGTTKAAVPRNPPRRSFAWYDRLSKKKKKEVLSAMESMKHAAN